MTVEIDPRRLQLVTEAADGWRKRLIDFTTSNTMLAFRNTKQGCLDLTEAAPDVVAAVVAGEKVPLRRLFPDQERHREACVRARALSRKIQLFEEEQGVEVGRLASGFVRTSPEQHKGAKPVLRLRAPLLLRPMAVRPRTASESDFTLEATDDIEVNPILLHVLNEEYGVAIEPEQFAAHVEKVFVAKADLDAQVEAVFGELARTAADQGIELTLEKAVVLGVFNYAKLPMVEDLAAATELLASHELVAALAGDRQAAVELAQESAAFVPPSTDRLHPTEEFLVQDADSSQHRAIATALAGRHVFIEGPPGTGKSQTIANIIAGAAATGKKVLFVAEKQAAIEAVVNRLAEVDLDGLVLDLHQQRATKREVARQLGESLERLAQQGKVDAGDLHDRLVRSRCHLLEHADELHKMREPWALSAYQVRERLLALGPGPVIKGGFRGAQLQLLDRDVVLGLEEKLRRYVSLGGLSVVNGETPWHKANIRSEDDVRRVLVELDELAGKTLRQGKDGMRALLGRTGLAEPRDISGWQVVLELLDQVSGTVQAFGPDIFGTELDAFWFATADRATRVRDPRKMPWKQRRAFLRQLREMSAQGLRKRADLHARLRQVVQQRQRWRELGGVHTQPAHVTGLADMMEQYTELRRQLAAVAASACNPVLETGSTPDIEREVSQLHEDRKTLIQMPTLTALAEEFGRLGLLGLIQQIAGQRLSPDHAWVAFERVWLESIEDELRLTVPALREFMADEQTRALADFRESDRVHLRLSAARVRRQVARQAMEARDSFPAQAQVLKRQASLRSRHLPIRKLVEQASDVLLAVRPCWAMSPLVVSRMLPAERLFDLVVFDEASQIRPHDAITSIMRGHRLVVAGDERQLPPSNFFDKVLVEEESGEDAADTAELSDYESVLTALRPVIPNSQMLRWHYRSADERLIAFSNREIYGDRLVTFPGAHQDSPVTLEVVHGEASPGQHGSAPAEVARVVELVLEHARSRPAESLGVITPGVNHQARIERALREARGQYPELAGFFSAEVPVGRRFFIKNLESVQGDERDAIILSVGVARDVTGKVNRTGFGVLNYDGSERRLNVAVTRAKRRMTVVSSFTAQDLEPVDRVTGTELLRRYLEFAAVNGRIDEVGRTERIELNGFERAIEAALRERGVPVHPQWGFSGYRIDFALAHRDEPGRMVLAVEADGDRYHRSESARDRDRLRQAHLEHLGWRFHRLWSSAWFADPGAETDRIVKAWEQAMAELDVGPVEEVPLQPVAVPSAAATERGPRPDVPAGLSIQDYSETQLIGLCVWLMSDRLLLDRDVRLQQAMTELGFKRRGQKILTRLTRAIEIAQHHVTKKEN
ncbi:AAA domain-containing protein [Amycolatopsis panacis]|uniref:DUF4011 domain-containing protein n=1 Tax=Amycolatopsis panacis TaxID=2340917 RepID=A0A419IAC8_9PSEU|nr:AAA domain-containing protein [Amycolatopsis panacis]RJQ90617.1 DUF4011 domain-containing protein [Amycolatopsis panacis]